MNTFLLLKGKAAILADPNHYSQNVWDCGTAACIAGWIARILGERLTLGDVKSTSDCHKFYEVSTLVKTSLKINDDQWGRLVHIHKWPLEFRDCASVKGCNAKERAITAGKRIDRFVETDGRE